jgi:hypothetical protein
MKQSVKLFCVIALLSAFSTIASASTPCPPKPSVVITINSVDGVSVTDYVEFACTDANGTTWIVGYKHGRKGTLGFLSVLSVGDTAISHELVPLTFEHPYTYVGKGWSFNQTYSIGRDCISCDTNTISLMGTLELEQPPSDESETNGAR